MNKTLLALSIGLSLGCASSVQAQTITITQLEIPQIGGETWQASGVVNSNGDGQINSVDNFFGQPWNAEQQNWFDTSSSAITWAGTGNTSDNSNANADFEYTFHLAANQVAVGTFFDWFGTNNIPILTIYDCNSSGCTGNSLPMVTPPFTGANFNFNSQLPPSPTTGVTIELAGGNFYECSEYGGSTVSADAVIATNDTSDIVSVDWSLDGDYVDSGDAISVFSPVDKQANLTVTVSTVASGMLVDSSFITVKDSIPPELNIQFIHTKSGEQITSVPSKRRQNVSVNYNVTDICDPTPTANGVATPVHPVDDGGSMIIKKQLKTSAVNIFAKAIDASGNEQQDEAILLIED